MTHDTWSQNSLHNFKPMAPMNHTYINNDIDPKRCRNGHNFNLNHITYTVCQKTGGQPMDFGEVVGPSLDR